MHVLIEVEYLCEFANTIEEIISTVSKELYFRNIDGNNNDNNKVIDDLDSYIEFGITEVQTV